MLRAMKHACVRYMGIVILLAFVASLGGCAIRAGQCEGGYCGVHFIKFAQTPPRPPKQPAELVFLRIDGHVPPGAEVVGYLEWAVNGFDLEGSHNCSEEIEGFLRGKAANLGFDGVVGVQQLIKQHTTSVTLTHADGSVTKHPINTHGAGSESRSGICVGFPFVFKTPAATPPTPAQ
jgi:hypothetical protein